LIPTVIISILIFKHWVKVYVKPAKGFEFRTGN
jgi:hypothetical protein